jgi:hypothetical protein
MKVEFSPEADEAHDTIDTWWRENRDKNPNLFDEEVKRVIELLPSSPEMGHVYKVRGGRKILRVLLSKTHHYLYYWVDEKRDLIEVIVIWGTPLKDGPPL